LLVPKILLSGNEIRELFSCDLFSFTKTPGINSLCLIAPLILVYGYAFPKAFRQPTFKIILISLLPALVNAPLEELLWRGLYHKFFSNNQLLFIFYSSFGFAIWHFVPQTIFPNKAPGSQWSFVADAFILGVLYSIVAKNTNSILLTSISHVPFDFSGLGGRIYLRNNNQ
jgi:CAAX protease family protein